jgi:hypothetical protein
MRSSPACLATEAGARPVCHDYWRQGSRL